MSGQVTNITGHVTKAEHFSFAYGATADLWKGAWMKADLSIEVAVKVFKKSESSSNHEQKRFLREVSVWAAVNHPHVVPLFGVSFDFDQPNTPCLVSPYYRRGNVTAYLRQQPSTSKLPLITQTANALAYLHSLSIIHGDIKSSQILINDKNQAVVTGFGLSRILDKSGFTTNTSSGTMRFLAPELIASLDDEVFIPIITEATDVWAFAMTVVEIFTLRLPFAHIKRDTSVMFSVLSGGRPKRDTCPQINDKIWIMLERCWDADPSRRPSMADLASFFASAAPTVQDVIQHSGQATRNLTDQVRLTETQSFAIGGFSNVWKGEWTPENSGKTVVVAVKIFKAVITNPEGLAGLQKTLNRELAVWSTIKHPNITPLYGFSTKFHQDSIPCLISPYYRHGDIKSYMEKQPDVDKLKLIKQIAAALSYLHGLHPPVIHGDIKASNILINDNEEASLADFGLSRIVETSGFTTKTLSGTYRFMAYELIAPAPEGEEESSPEVTAATDVWAFAMTVMEILTGHIPFSHLPNEVNVVGNILLGRRPKRDLLVNDEIWIMLERCWNANPIHRPSMAELSDFFTS